MIHTDRIKELLAAAERYPICEALATLASYGHHASLCADLRKLESDLPVIHDLLSELLRLREEKSGLELAVVAMGTTLMHQNGFLSYGSDSPVDAVLKPYLPVIKAGSRKLSAARDALGEG
jgi:hypothetical protein